MSCSDPTYLPTFQRQLRRDDPNGKYNCSAYAAAMVADYDSCGETVTTGKRVRELSTEPIPDPSSPGMTLGQVDDVLRRHFRVDLDTRMRYPWAEFERRISAGQAAILSVGYEPIRRSRFRGSETFDKGHAIAVLPGFIVMDPLCDGRRKTIYDYHGEKYPLDLLRSAAAALPLGNGRVLGDGFVYAAFSRDNRASHRAVVHPTPPVNKLAFWVYAVSGGVITGRQRAVTGGFSADCGAPRAYPWPGHSRRALVELTTGGRAGQYVAATFARETHHD